MSRTLAFGLEFIDCLLQQIYEVIQLCVLELPFIKIFLNSCCENISPNELAHLINKLSSFTITDCIEHVYSIFCVVDGARNWVRRLYQISCQSQVQE